MCRKMNIHSTELSDMDIKRLREFIWDNERALIMVKYQVFIFFGVSMLHEYTTTPSAQMTVALSLHLTTTSGDPYNQ